MRQGASVQKYALSLHVEGSSISCVQAMYTTRYAALAIHSGNQWWPV